MMPSGELESLTKQGLLLYVTQICVSAKLFTNNHILKIFSIAHKARGPLYVLLVFFFSSAFLK